MSEAEESANPGIDVKRIALWAAPALGLLLIFVLRFTDLPLPAVLCAGVTLWTALWWMFEPIPIPATSIIPLSVFPLLNIISTKDVASAYGHPLVMLMMGGFILSTAMESSGAHRRIALNMIRVFGKKSDKGVVFGFMLASATLSMWISNTATTLMLLPIALAVVHQANNPRLTIAILLGVAYAANVGGMGTPIGTPPNMIFVNQYNQSMQTLHGAEAGQYKIHFLNWMYYALPVVFVLIPLIFFLLTRKLQGRSDIEIPYQGPMRSYEKRVLLVFACTAIAWITRDMDGYGWKHLNSIIYGAPGPDNVIAEDVVDGLCYQLTLALKSAHDSSVALLAVIVMFLVPNGNGGRLLDWETANKIPWGLLMLFAGGIAIGKAFQVTGLSGAIGEQLKGLDGMPVFIVMLLIALLVTFLTEVTSTTATTNILMPILAATAGGVIAMGHGGANVHMVYMFPAVISASCAFMLPVATAPNSVVYGSGMVSIQTMMRSGFMINILGAFLIACLCYFWVI